jgi:arylsulfatase A-like enzyme
MTMGKGNHALRDKRWRYIRYSDGTEELYDHENDPWKWRNLAGDAAHGETSNRVRAKLGEALKGLSGNKSSSTQ